MSVIASPVSRGVAPATLGAYGGYGGFGAGIAAPGSFVAPSMGGFGGLSTGAIGGFGGNSFGLQGNAFGSALGGFGGMAAPTTFAAPISQTMSYAARTTFTVPIAQPTMGSAQRIRWPFLVGLAC